MVEKREHVALVDGEHVGVPVVDRPSAAGDRAARSRSGPAVAMITSFAGDPLAVHPRPHLAVVGAHHPLWRISTLPSTPVSRAQRSARPSCTGITSSSVTTPVAVVNVVSRMAEVPM